MTAADRERIAVVARRHGLRFVALFGSRARGQGRPESDLDLALMPSGLDRPGWGPLDAARELIHSLQRSDLDVVWLSRAPWLLQREVAREGRPLFEDPPGAFEAFQAYAHWRWMDSGPWRERERAFVQRYLEGDWAMNEDLVRHHLESMIRYLRELEPVLETPLDQFVAEPRDHHTAERLVELLVESAARVNTEVAACVASIPPSDYYSSFYSLSSAGWLDAETAGALAPLAGLRNLLVHQYQDIRLPDLYETLKEAMPHWREYVRAVTTRLEAR